MYDALVVGAGPAGSNVSRLLSEKGFRVMTVDLKEEIGIPNHCSGLVDERVVKLVGEELVTNRPSTAQVSTPSGSFYLNSNRMRVVDRVNLDKKLSEMAVSEGSAVSLRTLLLNFHQKKDRVVASLKSKNGFENVEAGVIIGADGPTSTVRRGLHIRSPKLLPSVQYDVSRKSSEVKISLDRRSTPEFFSWEIPNGDETEIGATGTDCYDLVKRITRNETILRKRGGLIPIGPTELGRGRGFLVGDAAGLSKATTGGGLYAALKSGEALSDAFTRGDNVLLNYKRNWLDSFGKEVNRAYRIRKLLDRYERYYDLWVPVVRSSLSGINRIGDVDYPSKTLLYVLGSIPLRFPMALVDFITLDSTR